MRGGLPAKCVSLWGSPSFWIRGRLCPLCVRLSLVDPQGVFVTRQPLGISEAYLLGRLWMVRPDVHRRWLRWVACLTRMGS